MSFHGRGFPTSLGYLRPLRNLANIQREVSLFDLRGRLLWEFQHGHDNRNQGNGPPPRYGMHHRPVHPSIDGMFPFRALNEEGQGRAADYAQPFSSRCSQSASSLVSS